MTEPERSDKYVAAQIQTAKTGTSPGRKLFLSMVIFLLLFSAGLMSAYYSFTSLLKPVTGFGEGTNIVITVPPGANSAQIGDLMATRGLIRNKLVFQTYAAYLGLDSRLQAGEYNFNTSLSTPEIIARLAKGETSGYSFTIPEGYTINQIVDRLEEKKLINRAKFLDLVARGRFNYDFLQGLPEGPHRLEGYLFPDTYRITSKTTEEDIINMMLARFAQRITPEFREKAAKYGFTVHQAVTLASIIEREAKQDEERPKVAAVFLNRLKKGWKLESCATIQYVLGKTKSRLFERDLQIDSPYNTYKYPGLPPGPIASPGRPSLEAAVNPANVDYMFFVVFEDGKHIFSRTLKEHDRNRAAYLKRLKAAQ